jgi:hypothetical protein
VKISPLSHNQTNGLPSLFSRFFIHFFRLFLLERTGGNMVFHRPFNYSFSHYFYGDVIFYSIFMWFLCE